MPQHLKSARGTLAYGGQIKHPATFPEYLEPSMNRLLLVVAITLLAIPASAADEPGFTPLFDGQTLAGWEGNQDIFRVESGAIVAGSLNDRVAHNEFLASTKDYGDFELRLKARLTGQGQNAGVQFRSQRVPDHFEMIGYQCDIGAMQGKPIWGALYDESRRRKFLAEPDATKLSASLKDDDWNDLAIRCDGPHIQIWVNGLQTVDYTESDDAIPSRGKLGLQIHGGLPAQASYKELRLRELLPTP